jgi:hypothetical protein
MSKDEWYSKLNKWAHEDSRLERMPLVYLRALAEHIASEQDARVNALEEAGREVIAAEARTDYTSYSHRWGTIRDALSKLAALLGKETR